MHGWRSVCPVTWIAKNSRTKKFHINHYNFKFHISFKRCRRKKRRWTTSPVWCPWIFHTTSFLSQIILFYWSLNNIKISSIAKRMYYLQKIGYSAQLIRHYSSINHPLFENPKGHCNGSFETPVNITPCRLVNSYRRFEGLSAFFRVNIPQR